MMRDIRKVILHCTDTLEGTLESITEFHVKQRGWSTIGYHYLITTDGAIHSGRPVEQEGAHCKGENANSIGVAMVGKDRFTMAQVRSLVELCKMLLVQHNLSHRNVHGHYEFDSAKEQGKTCPNFQIELFRPLIMDRRLSGW